MKFPKWLTAKHKSHAEATRLIEMGLARHPKLEKYLLTMFDLQEKPLPKGVPSYPVPGSIDGSTYSKPEDFAHLFGFTLEEWMDCTHVVNKLGPGATQMILNHVLASRKAEILRTSK